MRVCRRQADATDSPSRRALERKRNVPVPAYDDILEVEVVSSPPATRQVPSDEGFECVASSQQSQLSPQKPTLTPLTLGGSLFRRKAAVPMKDSSPLDASTILSSKMQSIDSQESATISRHESQDPLLSHRPTYPSEGAYTSFRSKKSFTAGTSYGKTITIEKKPPWKAVIRDQEKRSEARAHKEAYYGVDIHGLLNLTEDQPPTPFQSRSYYFPCLSLFSRLMVDMTEEN
jgi:hypothetical protein